LERICLACLAKEPAGRPTAAELAERLEGFLAPAGATVSLPAAAPVRRRLSRRQLLAGLAALAPLAGGVAWLAWPGQPTENEEPIRIRPLQVRHYATAGEVAEDRGPIGVKSFRTRSGDAVTVTVELSEPGYFYLIGFTFDGKEQLLWPADADGQAAPDVAPPLTQRLRHPPGDLRVYLDDNERGGLQVFVVAASRRPLPSYRAWREGRGDVGWQALPAGKTVWEADAQGAYPLRLGVPVDRSSVKELAGVPPLARLCRALTVGGVEVVEAVAFPVLVKEGGR
jgi:hypothetical protein